MVTKKRTVGGMGLEVLLGTDDAGMASTSCTGIANA